MLVTIAALIAAGASLINVVLTARFARRAALEAWRRERIYPLVVTLQVASRRHETKCWYLRHLRQRGGDLPPEFLKAELLQLHDEADRAYEDMSVALAELELVAPPLLVLKAQILRTAHMGFLIAEDFPDRDLSQEKIDADVGRARQAFVSEAREVLPPQVRLWPSLRASALLRRPRMWLGRRWPTHWLGSRRDEEP